MAKSIRAPKHRALLAVLVALRRHEGLTQTELAKRMRWTQSRIAQIESGQRQVYVSELFEFAKAFKVEAVDLIRKVQEW